MKKAATILIIDDNKIVRSTLEESLKLDYQIEFATDGSKGLEKALSLKPDLILLDVEMPNLNGYEVCEQIKKHPELTYTPIIFLSSHTSIEQKLQGYDAGGDDYVLKSGHTEELQAKVKLLLKKKYLKHQIKSEAKEAELVAIEALASSSELGQAMRFIEKSFAIGSISTLAEQLFRMLENFQLSGCILVKFENEDHFFSSNGQTKPLETDLISLLSTKDRIFDFKSRTQFNFSKTNLLIKNMPIDDPIRNGRIKDLIPAILSSLDEKVLALESEQSLIAQTSELMDSFNLINHTLEQLASSLKSTQEQSVQILSGMMHTLEDALLGMGLNEAQEAYIIKFIDDAVNETLDLTDTRDELESSFSTITSSIEQVLSKQKQSMLKISQVRKKSEDNLDNSGDIEDDDIELF